MFEIWGTDSNQIFLERSDHSPFPMKLLEVLHQLHGGCWGRQNRYHIIAFLTYSWENPYNNTINGATDSNRAFSEISGHS